MPTQVQHINCGGTINWRPPPSCSKCAKSLGFTAYIGFQQFQWVQVEGKPIKTKAERSRLHPSKWPVPIRILTVGIGVGAGLSYYFRWMGWISF